MKYMGSKNRIAKYLLPIILKEREERQWYVEPFVGGCNMIDKVDGNRIGADKNEYVIALFKALQDGWKPPLKVSEEEYLHIKNNLSEYDKALAGYVGFNSYGGKFFRGYRRDNEGKRDYWKEHHNNLMKQLPKLKDVDFHHTDYRQLTIPDNSIIYCDIPYGDTEKYKVGGQYEKFDYDAFFEWVRIKVAQGHQVFISEYTAPSDFTCVWSKEINSNLTNTEIDKTAVERLFTYR
jgi:DNA adenine methylase